MIRHPLNLDIAISVYLNSWVIIAEKSLPSMTLNNRNFYYLNFRMSSICFKTIHNKTCGLQKFEHLDKNLNWEN